MRNLKKILALVLALVMSLSLMATASASDFADADSINDTYETAVEVLEGLGVFKGYQEGSAYNFKPTGTITRAETAAIIYRIVTGDVDDKQVGIYTDYNLFSDVTADKWFAGYVNFCANAEYIKGNGDGTFSPDAQVTGYAALAMILRAIGYTANGGFTGDDWEVQTARTAEARKITKNILTGTLGQPASRETVAEILFQAILVNMVDHNQDNTYNGNQGYFETNITLGYKTFKLEEIQGVVTGNEFADLYGEEVLAEGSTNLETEDGIRSLATTTGLEDIGESRYAYITGSKVLAMGDTGLNKVTEFGHASDISTTAKFNATAEMPAAADIQYYQNFGRVGNYDCDQRIEFVVTFNLTNTINGTTVNAVRPNGTAYTTVAQIKADFENYYVNGQDLVTDVGMRLVSSTANSATYSKIIRAEEDISREDLSVIRGIFAAADNNNNTATAYEGVEGDVFVGTYSNANVEERDLSNSISYRKFFEEYINDITYDRSWVQSFNGDWVKFIDNDADGQAEYAFVTYSFLDEAIATYTNKAGDTVVEFNWFDDDATFAPEGRYTVRYLNGEAPVVGDVVVAALIDNQILVAPAESVTKTVQTYSWRDDEITTTDGDKYGQSGITNWTGMQEELDQMDEKTEYIMYFDHFGYVRAYELPGGTRYALVTELYYSNNQNGNLINEWPMTVELTMPNADGEAETKEYATSSSNPFNTQSFNDTPWLEVQSIAANRNYYNWLQPAISHLGVTRTDNTLGYLGAVNGSVLTDVNKVSFGSTNYTFWPNNYQVINHINSFNGSQEFRYGKQTYTNISVSPNEDAEVNNTTSFTNIAIVNGDDTVILKGAAQLLLNNDGSVARRNGQARYAVDYIQLATTDIAAGAVRYPIANGGNDANYVADNNVYVNAVHDTQYYIVYNGDVLYIKDFANFPGLTNAKNNIHAAYAVARDISSDNADQPYWVADVIVYEVESWDDTAKTSVSLAYYTNSRTTGSVQLVKTLNSKYGPMVDLTPGRVDWSADRGQWGAQWSGYGFYGLNNDTEPVDGVMTARSISRIRNTATSNGNYKANNIHAGIVTREAYIAGNGLYIDIDMIGNGLDSQTASVEITDKVYSITQKWDQAGDWYPYNEAELLRYNNISTSEVKAGDMVIWIGNAATNRTLNSSSFVVDLGGYDNGNYNLAANTASFLLGRTMNGVAVTAGNDWDAIAAPALDGNGEWQSIMWEQWTYTAPVDTYTLTLTGALTNAVGSTAGDLKDAFTTFTVDGKTPTYKDGVWTVKIDQGKLSYPVVITPAPGYSVTGLTVNADSAGKASVSGSYTLSVIGDVKLDLAVSYDSTTVAAAQVAALKDAYTDWANTYFNTVTGTQAADDTWAGKAGRAWDWSELPKTDGTGTFDGAYAANLASITSEATLLAAQKSSVALLADVCQDQLIALVGGGFTVDAAGVVTKTNNPYIDDTGVAAAYEAARKALADAKTAVNATTTTTEAAVNAQLEAVKTAYTTALTAIPAAIEACRTANNLAIPGALSVDSRYIVAGTGVDVTLNNTGAVVTVNNSDLSTWIAAAVTAGDTAPFDGNQNATVKVNGADVTGTDVLCVGVTITAPAGAKYLQLTDANGNILSQEENNDTGSNFQGGLYTFYVPVAVNDGTNWNIVPIAQTTWNFQFLAEIGTGTIGAGLKLGGLDGVQTITIG